VSEPLNLLDKVMVESTRFPHQMYNDQIGTITRQVVHVPGVEWEYDVHPSSNERSLTFMAGELPVRRAGAEQEEA
jgi:hypothetical protein